MGSQAKKSTSAHGKFYGHILSRGNHPHTPSARNLRWIAKSLVGGSAPSAPLRRSMPVLLNQSSHKTKTTFIACFITSSYPLFLLFPPFFLLFLSSLSFFFPLFPLSFLPSAGFGHSGHAALILRSLFNGRQPGVANRIDGNSQIQT
jgi:hypothetical protein